MVLVRSSKPWCARTTGSGGLPGARSAPGSGPVTAVSPEDEMGEAQPPPGSGHFPQSLRYASRYPFGSQDDLLPLLAAVVMWTGAI